MSIRKGSFAEVSQPQLTPSRHAPATPHAIRALQQRSGTKRSARSLRQIDANSIRPSSARNILRRFAKITAPITKKRVATPRVVNQDKENQAPEEDDAEVQKPNLTFAIDESIEDEDSELPAAPTPSVLPEDENEDEDDEQPTVTFQNIQSLRPASERLSRRRSRLSILPQSEAAVEPESDDVAEDGNTTIMTERGRRAISEEATGRLSRYSFGSIRMSDFGTELEVRRESDRQQKLAALEADDGYGLIDDVEYPVLGEETEILRNPNASSSPLPNMDDSIQIPGLADDTFQLEVRNIQNEDATSNYARMPLAKDPDNLHASSALDHTRANLIAKPSRPSALLQIVTEKARRKNRKRVKLTRHGNTVPVLPSSLIKRIASESQIKSGRKKPVLGKDHIKALEQATEWFFEQIGEDLAAYSSHGRRKKRIDADDVLLLMRRQRVAREEGELQTMANDWLPREMLENIELPEKP